MTPEVVGAFRLAMYHESVAGVDSWWWRKRRYKNNNYRKHLSKAQKLYARAARLEAKTSKGINK